MPDRVILLGAGASADAGIPTATKLLTVIREHLSQRPFHWQQVQGAFDAVIGALQQQNALRGRPFDPVDIEAVYAAFELLASRTSNLLAPFVVTWSPGLTDALRPNIEEHVARAAEMLKRDLEDFARSVMSGGHSALSHMHRFEDALRSLVDITGERQELQLRGIMNLVMEGLCHICWVKSVDQVAYLTPLLHSAATTPLWIATLNFDNTVELASRSIGMTVDIGVTSSAGVEFQERSALKLAKLHGSLDWAWKGSEMWSIDVKDGPGPFSRVIFGSENKLRVDGPYLDLLMEFRNVLESTDVLEVCGYSFRDSHVNYTILRWLNRAKGRRVYVIDPHVTVESILENVNANSGFYLPGARNPTPSPEWFRSVVILRRATAKEWAADAVPFSGSP